MGGCKDEHLVNRIGTWREDWTGKRLKPWREDWTGKRKDVYKRQALL